MNVELQTTEEGVVQESEAPQVETVEAEPTDEQKNEQAIAEAAERARVREEKKRDGVQKRIDELTREKYEYKAKAETLEQLLNKQSQPAKPQDDEPKRENFESYEEFLEARTEYRAEKIVQDKLSKFEQTQTQKLTQAQQDQARQESIRSFQERAKALEKDYPDFKEVMEDAEVVLPNPVIDMIRELPEGPLLAYHMANNPTLAEQFWNKSESIQGVLLGQMIATLKSTQKVSNAPSPGKSVSTAKHGSSDEPPSDPNLYRAWADKHLR